MPSEILSTKFLSTALLVSALLLLPAARAGAQSGDRLRETWRGPDPSLIAGVLRSAGKARPANAATKSRAEVLTFTPAGDSGVAKTLADAFSTSAEERTALVEAFGQIKQAYEAEVAKEGKSNNLAAAMTFFITTNVAAYHQTDLPPDSAGESLFRDLQQTMSAAPEFARLSNAEKQQTHDWLVLMAGFVLTGYSDARQKGDRETMSNFSQLADYSMRLALGVEVGKMSLAGNSLSIEEDGGGAEAGAAESKVVGVWSKSASSPTGMPGTSDATQKQAVYAGYYKGQYHFKPDGTYTFKAERRYGSTSQGFWTTEESGTYAVSGDSLTVSPRASKVTVRSLEGVVQKVQQNQLERVTYKWRLHYFEGLGETQLVLQAERETMRDGGFSANSDFPNSFLYSPGATLEWRF